MANLMLSKEDEKQVLESCNFETSGMSYLDEDETTFLDAIKKALNVNTRSLYGIFPVVLNWKDMLIDTRQ